MLRNHDAINIEETRARAAAGATKMFTKGNKSRERKSKEKEKKKKKKGKVKGGKGRGICIKGGKGEIKGGRKKMKTRKEH